MLSPASRLSWPIPELRCLPPPFFAAWRDRSRRASPTPSGSDQVNFGRRGSAPGGSSNTIAIAETIDRGVDNDVKSIIIDCGASIMMRIASLEPELGAQLSRHKMLRSRLLAEIPDLDAETLADTLEGLTDLREMLAELIRSALEDEALAAGLSTRLSDMKVRLERFETRARRKRQL